MGNLQTALSMPHWLMIFGLGCLWLGAQIVWVAPLPRQLRKKPVPSASPGTPEAFGLFWIDQYGWIGLVLCALGAVLVLAGCLS